MRIDWRVLALASMLSLQSCGAGGGGGGSTAPPPSGNEPPGGTPPPAADPTFTSDFFQFPVGVPKATVAADMDSDGRVDIVVLTADHFAGPPEGKAVHIFYQRSGGFDVVSGATAAGVPQPQSLAACDIDGDGKNEILVGFGGFSGSDLTVHKLDAGVSPLPPTTLPGVRSFTIECVDLDGDGRSDVVTHEQRRGFDIQFYCSGAGF